MVRNISNLGKCVGVVDERGEIASMYRGIPQNDLGLRTDVIENIPKPIRNKNVNKINGTTSSSSR